MDAASITAVFVGAIGVLGAFFAFVRWIVTQLVGALNKNSSSMEMVAKATTKAAKEAEKRNGHLAELAIENKESTLKAISMINSNFATQHVDNQIVEKQSIKGR